MKKQFNVAANRRLLIGSIAAALLVTAGMAMAWEQGSADGTGAGHILDTSPSEVELRAGVRCTECGVVESMRVIEQHQQGDDSGSAGAVKKMSRSEGLTKAAKTIRIAEITLRMNDGASHRFVDANPTNWRLGERVIFIKGRRSAD